MILTGKASLDFLQEKSNTIDMSFSLLTLHTERLPAQQAFYTEIIGFPLLEAEKTSFSVQIGKTRLAFKASAQAEPTHFAINIPSHSTALALSWLKERLPILPFDGKEIVDFSNWNAEAIYFHDPGGNIVEFIARRNLAIPTPPTFASSQCTCISEVGVGTKDIERIYRQLNEAIQIPIYDGSFDRFCALGDDDGLFIVVNYEKKKWFPTDEAISASTFEVQWSKGNRSLSIHYEFEELTIR